MKNKSIVKAKILVTAVLLLFIVFSCSKDEEYSLSITVEPAGSGEVVTSPSESSFVEGTEVTLTPQPASGYKFDSWGGTDGSLISNNKITIVKNTEIKAIFEISPQEGLWVGDYPNIYENKNAIQFYIANESITTSDDLGGKCMIVKFPFSNVLITIYIYEDINIEGASFSYISGSESSPSDKKTITGTFTSSTSCSGTAKYDESSSYQTAHAS